MDKGTLFHPGDGYLLEKQFTFYLNGKALKIHSKPGLPDWSTLPPATELLASYIESQPHENNLLLGCHHGALSAYIAKELNPAHLSIIDHNILALDMTRLTLHANHLDDLLSAGQITFIEEMNLPGHEMGVYDTVMILLPKGRSLLRRWLLQAYLALRNNGSLYLAGSNNTGIQSAISDAASLFGNMTIRGYKKGNRIAQLIKTESNAPLPEWTSTPGIAPHTWFEFPVPIKGMELQIHSLPGVFSYDHLDQATSMLIEQLEILPGMSVLDVGCGYGILGLIASTYGASKVDLVDSDLLATASARETLAVNHIQNAQVLPGDLLEPVSSNRYDLILSNPPFHAGHSVNYQITIAMIKQAYHALNPSGQLLLVANRFLPYDRLIKEIFGDVSCLKESRSYHVLSGIK